MREGSTVREYVVLRAMRKSVYVNPLNARIHSFRSRCNRIWPIFCFIRQSFDGKRHFCNTSLLCLSSPLGLLIIYYSTENEATIYRQCTLIIESGFFVSICTYSGYNLANHCLWRSKPDFPYYFLPWKWNYGHGVTHKKIDRTQTDYVHKMKISFSNAICRNRAQLWPFSHHVIFVI